MKKFFAFLLSLFVLMTQSAMGQAAGGQGGEGDVLQESLVDITTVMAIGGAGAILGLSTLSFVEEPKDHLKNILIGGSIGIIVGVGVIAYKQATSSRDQYLENVQTNPDFETLERTVWHSSQQQKILKSNGYIQSQVGYNFTF